MYFLLKLTALGPLMRKKQHALYKYFSEPDFLFKFAGEFSEKKTVCTDRSKGLKTRQ